MQHSHFANSTNIFGEGTISKSQVEKWFKKFKTGDTNLADEERRGWLSNFDDQALLAAVVEDERRKLDNQNVGRRLQCGPFDHRSLSYKARKSMEIGWMGRPLRLQQSLSEFSPIWCRDTSKLRSWRISSLGMKRGFSWKTSKKRFGFRQLFHPKKYRKASTVRKQCGVCHLRNCFLQIFPSPKRDREMTVQHSNFSRSGRG